MPELTFSFDAPLEVNRVSERRHPTSARRVPSDAMDQARLQGSNLGCFEEGREILGVGTVPPLCAFSQRCVQAEYLLLIETGTAYTSRSTTRSPSSARNPPCT